MKRNKKPIIRDRLIETGVRIAVTVPLHLITRDLAAKAAKVTPSLISYHFDGMENYRIAIRSHARKNKIKIKTVSLQIPRKA